MNKSPVAVVKERFQSKDKLVEAVQKLAASDLWLDRVNAAKGLAKVSNDKLIKLHDALVDAQKRFGTRDKLVSTIVELKKRTKDSGYTASLKKFPLPQLLDLHESAERAGKRAAAKAKGPKAKKPVVAKKAPAKKAAPAASKKPHAKNKKK